MDRGLQVKFDFYQEYDYRDRAYCSIAAALIGGSIVGAGASIWGANKAADAQKSAANASISNQQQMFGQVKDTLQPFITGGTNALSKLTSWTDPTAGNNPLATLIKLVTPGADQSSTLAQTPGYQFTKDQATRSIQNALAGRGLGGSVGAITKNVGDYSAGLASTTFNSAIDNLLKIFTGEGNALQNIVSTGANAGGNLATSAGSTASGISNAIIGSGNAQAAASNATGSAISNAANSIPTAYLLSQLTGGNNGGSIYGSSLTEPPNVNKMSDAQASEYERMFG